MAWIEYDLSTGFAPSTSQERVPDADLAEGRGQIECPEEMGDPAQYDVDVSQTPHVLVLKPQSEG
jgi:hypothetical protein